MWFLFTVLCTLAWGAADLFYKKGADPDEKYSHLKTSVCVGLVMGAHAIFTLLTSDIGYDPQNLLLYLPVSSMYILSMTVGYFGLRYLELSISSPVQNTSGALVSVLCLVVLGDAMGLLTGVGVILVSLGVFLLGFLEYKLTAKEAQPEDKKYRTGLRAFMMPILYCIIDAAGTFFDAYYLDDFKTTPLANVTEETLEEVANVSYELTFLIVALILFIYIRFIRREPFFTGGMKLGARLGAAAFETAGQYAYVFAMSGNGAVAAPVVASYCVVSVVLSRLFLREKLTVAQYISVAVTVAGIVVLGIAEGLAE